MPVMNGLDAAREITRIAPDVHVVMFTMHVSDELRRDAQAAGIRDVISKLDTIGDHFVRIPKKPLRAAPPDRRQLGHEINGSGAVCLSS
jgi:CheY-like chemotaxis protein